MKMRNLVCFSAALASMIAASASSFADDSFVPAELGLSDACVQKIISETHRQCNADSWAAEGKDRMHECINGQNDVKSQTDSTAEFEISYTAGDADDYWYDIQMTDKESCAFTFQLEQ